MWLSRGHQCHGCQCGTALALVAAAVTVRCITTVNLSLLSAVLVTIMCIVLVSNVQMAGQVATQLWEEFSSQELLRLMHRHYLLHVCSCTVEMQKLDSKQQIPVRCCAAGLGALQG